MRGRWFVALVPFIAMLGCGTARMAGTQAMAGATENLKKQIEEIPPSEQGVLAERAGKGATRGVRGELMMPESKEAVRGVVGEAVGQALATLSTGRQSGAQTQVGLPELADRAADAVMTRIEVELRRQSGGSCRGSLVSCLEGDAGQLGEAAGAGFVRGALRQLPWVGALIASGFILGLAVRDATARLWIRRARSAAVSRPKARSHSH